MYRAGHYIFALWLWFLLSSIFFFYFLAECISIVSYNMHGYATKMHLQFVIWYSPLNLMYLYYKGTGLLRQSCQCLKTIFPSICVFGSSAMSSCVESGVVRGRSFGGVMTLVNKRLSLCSRIICASDRYVIVTVGNLLIVNVYMPCSGTANTIAVLQEIINNLLPWLQAHPNHTSMRLPYM